MSNKKKKKFHIRQTICTILGIFLVVALFGAAMIFPDYYSRLYDRNTLNRTSFTDVNVSTYEASYNSFVEKLHAIARVQSGGGELRAVRTNELDEIVDRTDLTRIANNELQKLYELQILSKKIKPKEKRLTLCERYTVYETKETEGMKGISVWKMVYENSKRRITIILDEEYHKIYYMEICYKILESTVMDSGSARTIGYEKVPVGDVYMDEYRRWIEYCWPLLMKYYDIYSYQERTWDAWVQEEGNTDSAVLEFDEKYQIEFMAIMGTGEEFQKYRIGIPFEKMIQF